MVTVKTSAISRSKAKAPLRPGSTEAPAVLAGLPPFDEISAHHLMDEKRLVSSLVERAVFTADERKRASDVARRIVTGARANTAKLAGIDAFMKEYGLSSDEGVILMCLAESLLRISELEGTCDTCVQQPQSVPPVDPDPRNPFSPLALVNSAGMGPTFNADQCFICHFQPRIGGSSPKLNPAQIIAHRQGGINTVPAFEVIAAKSTETVEAVELGASTEPSPSCGTPHVGVVPMLVA